MKKAIIPIPDKDFDTTEVSITWKILKENKIDIIFATENGIVGETDPLLLTGVIFGQLGAKKDAIDAYHLMQKSNEFLHPIKYDEINPSDYDLLFLPGGHAKGMRQYLENKTLQNKIVDFFHLNKFIFFNCVDGISTSKSIVHNYNFTGLTKSLERLAYYLTKWKLDDYYKTYEAYLQDEVETFLANKSQFKTGFNSFIPFFVEDRNLLSARWPNDVKLLANKLVEKLKI